MRPPSSGNHCRQKSSDCKFLLFTVNPSKVTFHGVWYFTRNMTNRFLGTILIPRNTSVYGHQFEITTFSPPGLRSDNLNTRRVGSLPLFSCYTLSFISYVLQLSINVIQLSMHYLVVYLCITRGRLSQKMTPGAQS